MEWRCAGRADGHNTDGGKGAKVWCDNGGLTLRKERERQTVRQGGDGGIEGKMARMASLEFVQQVREMRRG